MAEKTNFNHASPALELPARACGRCVHGKALEMKGVAPGSAIECRWGPGSVIAVPQQMNRDGSFICVEVTKSPVRPAHFCCAQFQGTAADG